MKLTWTGIIAVTTLVIGAVLRILELSDVSNWAIRVAPIVISAMMVFISYMVWKALSNRKSSEKTPWLWFTFAATANLLAMIAEAMTKIMPESAVNFSIGSSGCFLVAYICFIVGFWLESIQVEWVTSKFNIWIPLIVNVIGFGVVTYFLLKELAIANMTGIWSVTFISFVAMDFILIGVIWAVVARTRGGKLSVPYITIGAGCLLLVIFHIFVTFLITRSLFDVDNIIRVLLMVALATIVVGGDFRFEIEKQLE